MDRLRRADVNVTGPADESAGLPTVVRYPSTRAHRVAVHPHVEPCVTCPLWTASNIISPCVRITLLEPAA